MRRDYKVFLTTIFIVIFIIASGLLLGTYDATQADTFDCERIRSECVPRGERPICPNMDLTPRCPMDERGIGGHIDD